MKVKSMESGSGESQYQELYERLMEAQKLAIGLGAEWRLFEDGRPAEERRLADPAQEKLRRAYEALYSLAEGKDYYLVTTVTDGAVYDTAFDGKRVTAPCGNIHWRQCSKACTKDIWEEGEVPSDICPHCGAPMTGNTIQAEAYIEEGYLPGWTAYKTWQGSALNRRLLMLELGAGLDSPTVIRWPFERIAFLNQKAYLFRVHENLSQLPKDIQRAGRREENSLDWVLGFAAYCAGKDKRGL